MKDQDYMYAVYTEKTFSGAAKKLYVSQPALSLAVKRVEESLGITVFDRSVTPLRLTEEGKVYIEALENIRAAERTLNERLSDLANLKSGHVIVSGENFVSSFILPEILMRYSKKFEGITVELVESNSPDLRQLLLSENIDLLVAHDFDSEYYEAEELFNERIYLAVPEYYNINNNLTEFRCTAEDICSSACAQKPSVDLSLFKNEEFLLMKPGNDTCRRAAQFFKEAGFEPKERIRLDQLITAYNLCAAGMGLTFVSDMLVKKAQIKGCIYYRIDSPYANRKMCIGYKKNRYVSRASKEFIEMAKETYHI